MCLDPQNFVKMRRLDRPHWLYPHVPGALEEHPAQLCKILNRSVEWCMNGSKLDLSEAAHRVVGLSSRAVHRVVGLSSLTGTMSADYTMYLVVLSISMFAAMFFLVRHRRIARAIAYIDR